jgi:hypothetical protein
LPDKQRRADYGQSAEDDIQDHRWFLNTMGCCRKHGIRRMR